MYYIPTYMNNMYIRRTYIHINTHIFDYKCMIFYYNIAYTYFFNSFSILYFLNLTGLS